MVKLEDFGNYETAWCPGCGNFPLIESMKKAFVSLGLGPHQIMLVSGIGQAAKSPHYINSNVFNGLHGRSLPAAQAIKMANSSLNVVVESGDGCMYGEGGNHFLSAIRRNVDITVIVHDNQVYGLTKGQASPTTSQGQVTKAQPNGVFSDQLNPVELAVAMKASFVARSFTGMPLHLEKMIALAIEHKGFSIVDVFQPCISFNKVNTFAWYKSHCYELDESYDPTNWDEAIKKAAEFGDKIPVGVIYKNQRPTYGDFAKHLGNKPLVGQSNSKASLKNMMEMHY